MNAWVMPKHVFKKLYRELEISVKIIFDNYFSLFVIIVTPVYV